VEVTVTEQQTDRRYVSIEGAAGAVIHQLQHNL